MICAPARSAGCDFAGEPIERAAEIAAGEPEHAHEARGSAPPVLKKC